MHERGERRGLLQTPVPSSPHVPSRTAATRELAHVCPDFTRVCISLPYVLEP